MIDHDEKIYQIAFALTKGIGPRAYRLIMDEFEHASEIFSLSDNDLKQYITKESIRQDILNKVHIERAKEEFDYCQNEGVQILHYKDKAYPQRLNFFDNIAGILYFKGNADLNAKRIVSIVGTRNPSEYGKIRSEKIVAELQRHNCLIISGLAYGIDIIAHRSALKNNLQTVGVMASGHSVIYPPDHKDTAKLMLTNGGLLTEFKNDEEMKREMFPMRNRIVAAMCDAVIVVQSAAKGGSLITANFASEYNKTVFAIPGRPDDSASKGCNLLIKTQRASMYESIVDLEDLLNWDAKKMAVQTSLFEELNDDEKSIINYIRHVGEGHVDDIHRQLKKTQGSLAAVILNLELKGIIKSIPGKRYICT